MSLSDYADTIPCAYCGADAGEPCRTSSGAWATHPHSARFWPLQRVWVDGFEDGQRDILGALDAGWDAYIDRARTRIGGQS